MRFTYRRDKQVILSHGKKNRLEAVYDKYADMLFRLALSHLQRREDAEDAVQDVFMKYYSTSPHFDDDEHERAWLVRVTVNRCHDLSRRGKIRDHASLDDILEIPSEERTDAGNILSVVGELPEKYKTVIVLHYLEGFSVEEVSKMLKLSLSAVKMRLSRGRDLLKNLINEEEG